MIPQDAWSELFRFTGALAIVTSAMAWWRKETAEDDSMVVAATDVVLEALSDGDLVERTDCIHHKNMRDAVSVQEAIDMASEAELRRFGWGRN